MKKCTFYKAMKDKNGKIYAAEKALKERSEK